MKPVIIYGNPVLRQIAEPVEYNEENLAIAREMLEIMYDEPGVGLAAPQIGISKRIVVIDVGDNPTILFNPEIIWVSEEQVVMEEGCLSLPGINAEVTRPAVLKLRAINEKGVLFEKKYDEYMARVIQHETDHLNGVLFIDHVSAAKRVLINSALKKLRKQTLAEMKEGA